jgi:SlyX protein
MDIPPAIEHRLTTLEIKASYTEDTLDQLNAVIVRQQQQIELLLREVAALKAYGTSDIPAARTLSDDLPPHY